jgi:hypothetical protein
VASRILQEAVQQDAAAFHERSARSLQKMSAALQRWQARPKDRAAAVAVVRRLRSQLTPACGRLPASEAQRALCEQLLAG